jgi:plastocyanin
MRRLVLVGIVGSVLLIAGVAHGALHSVNVNASSFSPSNIEINQNDQIKWLWTGGTHTTTSGTPGNPNGIWNSSITSGHTSYTQTFGTVGSFPYYCSIHNFTGNVIVDAVMGIFDDPSTNNDVSNLLALRQNFPNPFNAETQFEYSLDKDEQVEVAIYNILGQKVRTIAEGMQSGGLHEAIWDGRDDYGNAAPSGIFFARMVTPSVMMTRKMVLLR